MLLKTKVSTIFQLGFETVPESMVFLFFALILIFEEYISSSNNTF